MTYQIGNDGKTVAIISYITWIGWIIAYIMHSSNKTSLGAFHLRQSGFIYLASILFSIFTFVDFGVGIIKLIVGLAQIGLFILWIIGLLGAINGEEKKVPVIGDMAQNILSGIK